jgi:hypothetical protein
MRFSTQPHSDIRLDRWPKMGPVPAAIVWLGVRGVAMPPRTAGFSNRDRRFELNGNLRNGKRLWGMTWDSIGLAFQMSDLSLFETWIFNPDDLPICTRYRKGSSLCLSQSRPRSRLNRLNPVLPRRRPIASSKPAGDSTDTVKLSQDAQIQLLAQQGQSPSEIAQNLGIAAITVAAYLGEAPLPPPPAPEPQSGPSPTASIPAMS